MQSKLQNTIMKLVECGLNVSDFDSTDLRDCLKSFFYDEGYEIFDVYEILNPSYQNKLIADFYDETGIRFFDSQYFKTNFPKYERSVRIKCASALFIQFIGSVVSKDNIAQILEPVFYNSFIENVNACHINCMQNFYERDMNNYSYSPSSLKDDLELLAYCNTL